MKNNRRAFTLIELLVVIAIIGILATISVLALSNARAKSRDAKRAGDIKQIQTALELFFNDNNRYPTAAEWAAGKIYSTSTGVTSTYMQVIPTAPIPADGTCTNNQNTIAYIPSVDGSSYGISFCLGNTTGTLSSGIKCLTPGGILDRDCFACGEQVSITAVGNRACNESAPYYDKCTYDTVRIGDQCWMKQNMNIGDVVLDTVNQSQNSITEKYCYGNSYVNCQNQGGLYQWNEAMQYSVSEGAQGICPTGWHIPTDAQQDLLDQYLKGSGNTCNANRTGWDCDNAGTKLGTGGSSGFDALLAGYREPGGSFWGQGTYSYLWSSSISGASNAWYRLIAYTSNSGVYRGNNFEQVRGFLVRCLKD